MEDNTNVAKATTDTPKSNSKPASKYIVASRFAHYPLLSDVIDGRTVNIKGTDFRGKREPTLDNPSTEVFIPAATEADLDKYYAKGNQNILIKVS